MESGDCSKQPPPPRQPKRTGSRVQDKRTNLATAMSVGDLACGSGSLSADHTPADSWIQLPRSSDRSQKKLAHLKLLTGIRNSHAFNAEFEGRILTPGSRIDRSELLTYPVVLECVGYVGSPGRGRKREVLWILRRLDRRMDTWVEIARAQSLNAEWVAVLRQPAINAMRPAMLVDVLERGRDLAEQTIREMDRTLELETAAVKANMLSSVYDQVAGRLADLAA